MAKNAIASMLSRLVVALGDLWAFVKWSPSDVATAEALIAAIPASRSQEKRTERLSSVAGVVWMPPTLLRPWRKKIPVYLAAEERELALSRLSSSQAGHRPDIQQTRRC